MEITMQVVEHCPTLDGIALPLKEQVCRLGIHLDSKLHLDSQGARKAFDLFQLVCQLQSYLDCVDLAMVIHATVISRLDYWNTFYLNK